VKERKGGKWDHVPRGASTFLIQPIKNAVLSRNLDQNMPKNAYFWKNSCVKSPQRQGIHPWSPITFAYCCSFRRVRF